MLTPIETKLLETPKACFWAVHNGATISATGHGRRVTPEKILCAETKEELDAKIEELGLVANKTKRQAARDLFLTFPQEIQSKFGLVLKVAVALKDDSEVIRAVEAVEVLPEEQAYKDQILQALR